MRRVRIKDDALEQRMFFQRSLIAILIVVLIALLLVGRAFWLQVLQHDHYLELSLGIAPASSRCRRTAGSSTIAPGG